jgi:hypothetical protein
MSQEKSLETRLRFRFREHSLDGMLLKYLLKYHDKDIKELLWEAARMCFLPMAYVNLGGNDEKKIKNLAISSFFELSRQWNYIQIELKLDLPSPKILLQSTEGLEIALSTSNDEVQPIAPENRLTETVNNDNQFNLFQQVEQDDEFWDDDNVDIEVDLELSAEEKAIRDEMDALF